MPAAAGVRHPEIDQQDGQGRHHHRSPETRCRIDGQPAELGRQSGHGFPPQHGDHQTAVDSQGSQGHHDGVKSSQQRQDGVQNACRRSRQQSGQDGQGNQKLGRIRQLQDHGGGGRRESHHRADGNVDSPAHNDRGGRQAQDGPEGGVRQQVQQAESLGGNRQPQAESRHAQQQRQLVERPPLKPGPGRKALGSGRFPCALPGQSQGGDLGGTGSAGIELPGDLPLAKDHHPVGMFQDLGQLGRDQEDGATLPGQVPQVPVDLGLGAHVDSASGFVQDEHPGLGQQPAPQDHLLLVAARQLLDRLFGGAVAHLQPSGDLAGRLLLPGPAGQKAPGPTSQGRQHRVGANGQTQAETLAQAVLGDVGDTGFQRVPGPVDPAPAAVYPDQALGLPQTEHRPGKLAAPGPDQAVNPHDFTRTCLQVDLSEAIPSVGEPADLKAGRTFLDGGGACLAGGSGSQGGGRPPHHGLDHLLGTGGLPGSGPHLETVTQYGYAIGQSEDLFLAMGDIEDSGPVRLQAGNLLEEPAGLLAAQGAGGLVQHHHPGVLQDGRGHLDHLAVSHAEPGGRLADVDPLSDLPNRLPGLAVHPVPIHQSRSPKRESPGQRHVLGNRKGGEQLRFLMDGDHPLGAGSDRGGPAYLAALEEQLSGVGSQRSADDLDQGALAGAVLAHQGMHLARVQIQGHPAEGHHPRKGPPNIHRLQDGRFLVFHFTSACRLVICQSFPWADAHG